MEAKEFVKDCGMEVAKRTLDNAIGFGCSGIELFGGKYVFRTDELKQIVDAFKLVESASPDELYKIECSEGIWSNTLLSQAVDIVELCE